MNLTRPRPGTAAAFLAVAMVVAACGSGAAPAAQAAQPPTPGQDPATVDSLPARPIPAPSASTDLGSVPTVESAGATPADPAAAEPAGSSDSKQTTQAALPTEDPAISRLLREADEDLSTLDGALDDDATNTTQNGDIGELP